ncbi:MAG: TY-Chap domain-containing protein [Actinomycetota bacterium]
MDAIRTTRPGEAVHSPSRRLVDETDLRVTSVHAEVLAREIRDLLTRQLADGHCFIIFGVNDGAGVADRNRYVQTATSEGDSLLAESVGERYTVLEPEELRELELFGWFPPDPDDPIGNFNAMWEPPDVADTAQLLALTLVRVHGLRSPEQLTIKVGETWEDS